MNIQTSLSIQAVELRRLLESAASDPVAKPQLERRLQIVEEQLQSAVQGEGEHQQPLPRTAIFIRGGGVLGTQGIKPSLAGESLIQYEKMFVAQAIHDEREVARQSGMQRRPAGALKPGLLFIGTPRGSFGLEFVPSVGPDQALVALHAKSLKQIAIAIVQVATETTEDAAQSIAPEVLRPMRAFLKTLASNGAELRLSATNDPSVSLRATDIERAVERLEREVVQDEIELSGDFKGLTLESGNFDVRIDDGHVITGHVDDNLETEELERIYNLLNQRCAFRLVKTTVVKGGVAGTPTYVLLDAQPVESDGSAVVE